MPSVAYFNGQRLVKPGAASRIDAGAFNGAPVQGVGVLGLIGEASGGKPGEVIAFTNPKDMEKYFRSGPLADAARLAGNPLNDPTFGGKPNTFYAYKTNAGVQASKTLTGTSVGPGTVSSAVGPFDLVANRGVYDSGDSNGLNIEFEAGGSQAFTFDFVQATLTGSGLSIVDIDTETLIVEIDGGDTQTVTFSASATTAAIAAAEINAQLLGGSATVVGGEIKLISDKYGTGSQVEITGGTALGELGLSVASASGTGDFADASAATAAEFATAMSSITNGTATAVGGALVLTSATSGGSSTAEVASSSLLDTLLGFDNDTHAGSAATDVLVIKSKDYGAHTNKVKINVIDSGTGKIVSAEFLDGAAAPPAETITIEGLAKFTLQYTGAGSAATITMTDSDSDGVLDTIATTVTGDAGASVSFSLISDNILTINDLVAAFNAHTNTAGSQVYTAAVVDVAQQYKFNPSQLDAKAAATNIKSAAVSFYGVLQECIDAINGQSSIIEASLPGSVTVRVPPTALTAATRLTGGSVGASTNATFEAANTALRAVDAPQIALCASEDGSGGMDTGDLVKMSTGSSHVIATVLSNFAAEIAYRNSSAGKKESMGYAGIAGNKSTFKNQALTLNTSGVLLTSQSVLATDSNSNTRTFPVWGGAVLVAAARASVPPGEPLTSKFFRADDLTQDSSWTPESDGDELLLAGCAIFEKDARGVRLVRGRTTYTRTENDVYIEEGIITNVNAMAKGLREMLEANYTGRKATTQNLSLMKEDVIDYWESMRSQNRIVDSTTNGQITQLAYHDISITKTAEGYILVDQEVFPVEGINWIFPTIRVRPAEITL